MTKYTVTCKANGAKVARFLDDGISSYEYFEGYDFMGNTLWSKDEGLVMDLEEAEAIVEDLEAAEADLGEDLSKKTFLVKTSIEDEPITSLMTGKEITKLYEDDQLAGVYGEIKVYDIEDEPKRINLLDLVAPILQNQRWMEQEYRDYCENERY